MDPQVISIVERAVREGLVASSWILLLITLVGAGIGAFLASYLKKKGELRALKEDFDEVLRQVHAQTKTTEEVKGEVAKEPASFTQRLERRSEFDQYLHKLHPTLFYQWQKAFFENGAAAFESRRPRSRSLSKEEDKIAALEAKLRNKTEVLAEVVEELVRRVRDKMVADAAGEFDGIGHATGAKSRIGIGWPGKSLLLFVVPPKVKVRRARKHGGDSINQGDGLAVNTEERGYEDNGFDAISILGHPSSGALRMNA